MTTARIRLILIFSEVALHSEVVKHPAKNKSLSAAHNSFIKIDQPMRCYTRHRHCRRSKSKSTLHLMFTANTKKPMTSHRTIEKVAANMLGAINKSAPNLPPDSPKKIPSSSTSLSPSSKLLHPHSLSSRSPSSAMTVAEGKKLSIRLKTQEDMVRQTLGSIQKEWSLQQAEIAKAISDAGHGGSLRLEQRQSRARDMVHVELLLRKTIAFKVEIALESRYAERIFRLETEVAVLRAEAACDRRRLKACEDKCTCRTVEAATWKKSGD